MKKASTRAWSGKLPAIGAAASLIASALNVAVLADDAAATKPADQAPEAAATNSAYRLPTITISATELNPEPQSEGSAITVLSGSQIGPGGIREVRDFPAVAPNLSVFDANNTRSPKFSVRGLRENNFGAGEPALGLYVDDVPYTDLNSRGLPLFNIEQVDFLRGPQGTLYGASGPGGVINIYTRQPGNAFHGYGHFDYGNYNSQDYQGGISGPVVKDKLFFSVDGLYSLRDGFVHNLTLDTHPDTRDTLSGRAQLRWTPNDAWDISLLADGGRDNDGFVPTFSPQTGDQDMFNVNRDFDGFVHTKSFDQHLKIAYQTPDIKVTSVTSHRYWKQDLQQDFDFSPGPFVIGFTDPRFKQWSEELRVQSPEGAGPLQWLGGFYFADKDFDGNSGQILPSGQPPFLPPGSVIATTAQFEDQNYALFGQAIYTVIQDLDVIAGLRLEDDDRAMNNRQNPFAPTTFSLHRNFEAALPKAGLVYHLTPKQSIYAKAAAGYQSGGFNASNDDPTQAGYGGVNSWNFELGYKSSWFDDKLTSRAALFYSRFHGYQDFRFNTNNPTEAFVVNAERAHSYGAELELEARPVKEWEFSAALGYTEAKFDRFNDAVNGANFNDKNITFVPKFTALLAAQYTFREHLYARAEMQGVGDYYLNENNSAKQNAYALFNARVGYEWKNFEVFFFGRNLFDKRYANNALDFPAPTGLILQPGDPMTYGFGLTARF